MARGKGRPPGFIMGPEHRGKIANSGILKRLVEHVEGKVEMTATQVQAGLGLLRKVMPDQTENKNDTTLTDARLTLTKTIQGVDSPEQPGEIIH